MTHISDLVTQYQPVRKKICVERFIFLAHLTKLKWALSIRNYSRWGRGYPVLYWRGEGAGEVPWSWSWLGGGGEDRTGRYLGPEHVPHPPPLPEQTHTCENISSRRTTYAGGKIYTGCIGEKNLMLTDLYYPPRKISESNKFLYLYWFSRLNTNEISDKIDNG